MQRLRISVCPPCIGPLRWTNVLQIRDKAEVVHSRDQSQSCGLISLRPNLRAPRSEIASSTYALYMRRIVVRAWYTTIVS